MASFKTYLVPVDFSRTSGVALNYAVKLARESHGKLLLVHVITDTPEFVPLQLRDRFYADLEKKARRKMENLMRRKPLGETKYRTLVIQGGNPARLITDQAKRSRVSMIVMGSRGHTGVKRFVLGSVAETTVRYAQCPVLIVKR